jgi:CDP-4-dehydro-6-deoxyglucose reductase, E3
MPRLQIHGQIIEAQPEETVLAALLRAGVRVGHSCQAGACQSCLLVAQSGVPDPRGQQGLKDTLRAQGYFLSCITPADRDLVLADASEAGLRAEARVSETAMLSETVLRMRLRPLSAFSYRAGQFINIQREDGYSLASVPALDSDLELHVRVLENGRMSRWLKTLEPGHRLLLRGPAGECFYLPGRPQQPLLLVGSGTGLAPLWGIARDAIQQGHQGPIVLLHGARNLAGLYYRRELTALAQRSPQLRYQPCVLDGTADLPSDVAVGSLSDLVTQLHSTLAGFRVFLCGDPLLVRTLMRQVFLAGASRRDIAADAFLHAPA